MRCIIAVALLVSASKVLGDVDMTTFVEGTHYKNSGNWRFENTSNYRLKCHVGLVDTPRWSTSLPPKSPKFTDSPVEVRSTIGTRDFEIEPRGFYVHYRNDVGTFQCEVVK